MCGLLSLLLLLQQHPEEEDDGHADQDQEAEVGAGSEVWHYRRLLSAPGWVHRDHLELRATVGAPQVDSPDLGVGGRHHRIGVVGVGVRPRHEGGFLRAAVARDPGVSGLQHSHYPSLAFSSTWRTC
jgi:hypothetical protein